jgi:transposase InsO family protein
MNESIREKIALFRYQLISPILVGEIDNLTKYFERIATKVYDVPHYGKREYSPTTFATWLMNYRKSGFDGLKPKKRSDKNNSRKIDGALKQILFKKREEFPKASVKLVYDELLKTGVFTRSQISYSTIYRFYKKHNLLTKRIRKEGGRKRFAHEKVNALWQGDTMVGPYLKLKNKKVKTFLFAFIDDCSRIIPHAEFFTSEKFSSVKNVVSTGILKRGLPKLIYVDNGKVYTSDRLHFACASLGITLIHTKPYDASAKGKIERFFLTVRKRFIPLLTETDLASIKNLNQKFFNWLEVDYHRKKHSALNMKPIDKYMSQQSRLRMLDDPEKLKQIFLKRISRKVRHDATITLDKELYEVSPELISKSVEVRFDPELTSDLYIYYDGHFYGKAVKVNFEDNAHVKRDNPISFKYLAENQEVN